MILSVFCIHSVNLYCSLRVRNKSYWLSKTRSLFWLELSACRLSDDYSHSPLPVAMKFRINKDGTKAKRNVCKDFLFPSFFKMAAVLCVFFAVAVHAFTDFHEIWIFYISLLTERSEVSVWGRAFCISSVWLCVCLSHNNYGQSPWPVVIIFCKNVPYS